MSAPLATFTYWDDDDVSPIAGHLAHWREHFPEHAVLTRKEARQLLERRAPQFLEVFDRIALPACRSDIARLLKLEAAGGLYVDAHCSILDPRGIATWHQRLDHVDLVVSTRHAPKFAQIMPHNSIIWAKLGTRVLARLIESALGNLADKAAAEMACGFEPYHVWALTGPGVFWEELFDTSATDGQLTPSWARSVDTIFETDNPIRRHHYTSYRQPGSHWSERQNAEPLFL